MISNSKFKLYLKLLVRTLFVCLITATNLFAASQHVTFSPGEKLTFKLKWGLIPAGSAVLKVLPIETIGGIKSYHFVMTVRTNAFIDVFYKYRSRVDAYADEEMTRSILYHKKIEVLSKIKEVGVDFDWEKNAAQYYKIKNETIVDSKDIKKKKFKAKTRENKAPISILPGSFDPLSAFYYARIIKLDEKTEIQRPVTDGKKCVMGYARVKKGKRIRMADGMYNTWIIEPDLKHIEGVFERSKNAKIQLWVTADERRIPVKVKSKVIVGNFTGKLVSASNRKK